MARLPPETMEQAISARETIRRGWQRYRARRILLQSVDRNGAFIFIHVPKTAGTSIAAALGRRKCSHGTSRDYRTLLGRSYDEMFSFAFVRNPWDRFMSLYRYARMLKSHHHSARFPWLARYGQHPDHNLLRDASPSEAARMLVDGRLSFQWLPQHHWVCDDQGRLDVSFCGRFETFDRDMATIRARVPLSGPLPMLNRSEGRERNPAEHIDPATKELLGTYYEKDIALFGYRFSED